MSRFGTRSWSCGKTRGLNVSPGACARARLSKLAPCLRDQLNEILRRSHAHTAIAFDRSPNDRARDAIGEDCGAVEDPSSVPQLLERSGGSLRREEHRADRGARTDAIFPSDRLIISNTNR